MRDMRRGLKGCVHMCVGWRGENVRVCEGGRGGGGITANAHDKRDL